VDTGHEIQPEDNTQGLARVSNCYYTPWAIKRDSLSLRLTKFCQISTDFYNFCTALMVNKRYMHPKQNFRLHLKCIRTVHTLSDKMGKQHSDSL